MKTKKYIEKKMDKFSSKENWKEIENFENEKIVTSDNELYCRIGIAKLHLEKYEDACRIFNQIWKRCSIYK